MKKALLVFLSCLLILIFLCQPVAYAEKTSQYAVTIIYGDYINMEIIDSMEENDTLLVDVCPISEIVIDFESSDEEKIEAYKKIEEQNIAFLNKYYSEQKDRISFCSKYSNEVSVYATKSELLQFKNDPDILIVYKHHDEPIIKDGVSPAQAKAAFEKYLFNLNHNFTMEGSTLFTVYGESKGYTLFFGCVFPIMPSSYSERIGSYHFVVNNEYDPYILGYFATDGNEVLTLREVFDEGIISIHDAANAFPNIEHISGLGDINQNGTLDISDVTEIQKILANMKEMPEDMKERIESSLVGTSIIVDKSDFNDDGSFDINDATDIQKELAHIVWQ